MLRFKNLFRFLSVWFWVIAILSISHVAVSAAEKPEIFVQMGHTKRVNSVAFSPDGKYALSGSWDKTLKLWEIASGREVRTFYGTEKVTSIAVSPNGKYVISGDEDRGKNLKLWDMASGKRIRTFSGDIHRDTDYIQDTDNVIFSPDGKHVLSGGENLNLWDIASGKKLRTFRNANKDNARIVSIVISPDGRYVISGSRYNGQVQMPDGTFTNAKSSDNTIGIWDIVTGEKIRAFNGGKGWVTAIAISPDGKHVISGDYEDSARMWDIATGRQVKAFNVEGVSSIAVSPDGKYALFGGVMNIRLWDIEKDREIKTFSGHSGWVRSVAFSPDGKYALSGSDDNAPMLWDIASGKELRSFGGYTQQVGKLVC
ncbi:MAG: WD40 repeat domain-containing protein [Nitrospirae bacterium]|nr:WD40 repeat domain-containing protein [Nitrospirota bacterium]